MSRREANEGPGARARRRVRRRDLVARVLDVVAGTGGLVVLSPVLVVIALAIRATMGSPVLFRDVRAGRFGARFTLVKFRTMRPPTTNAERAPEADDARVTRLGRFLRASSLDELPALWNVLRGEMALVGPRPLPLRYVDRYTARQARRLEVRPGITGWAQVNGRNALAWPERLELDAWYVEHRSLALDLRILARTFRTVVRREGIRHAGHPSMPELEGPA